MDYTIIVRPLIGAGIGYITNWIAVKMMFRPLKPIKIGKFTLPFTPGIIPKNKTRIAHSISIAITENLLTKEDIEKTLLSPEIEKYLKDNLSNFFNETTISLEETITKNISIEKYTSYKENISNNLAKNIVISLEDKNIGKLISEQIVIAVNEKITNPLIKAFISNSMITALALNIEEKINEYVKSNGTSIISDLINSQIDKYMTTPVNELNTSLKSKNIDLTDIMQNVYKSFIATKVSEILKLLNIPQIIENKINEMDMLELEKIILQVMKKELNALVNLGALIGFILGLLNLLF